MKTFCISLIVLCSLVTVLSWITIGIWNWQYKKNYEYALKLCDDASLPKVKAEYLKEYKEKVKTISGAPRYIFMTPDLELKIQLTILDGLIKRFEDIVKIDPSNMAYQQGMYQLTGQEIDHQLKRISGIFLSAKFRENILLFIFMAFFSWILIIPIIFLFFFLMEQGL